MCADPVSFWSMIYLLKINYVQYFWGVIITQVCPWHPFRGYSGGTYSSDTDTTFSCFVLVATG